MEYSFPRYLLSKQTVDDRALNKDVLAALTSALSDNQFPESAPLSVIEVGAGLGTMLTRLLRWNILPTHFEYTLVDEMRENTDYARAWIPSWAVQNGYQVESVNADILLIASETGSACPSSPPATPRRSPKHRRPYSRARSAASKWPARLGHDVGKISPEWYRTADILKSHPGKTAPEGTPVASSGVFPVLHCNQEIPCDPCTGVCPNDLIEMDETDIRLLPSFVGEKGGKGCTGCEKCVAICPGLAITLVDYRNDGDFPTVAIPFEFLKDSLKAGDTVTVEDTEGGALGRVEVAAVKAIAATAKGKFLYLKGTPTPPLPQESGWKDTVIMYPGQVTRILVRWAPTDIPANTAPADANFPFDPNGGHGYVRHCHIVDHEDNEMMRPDEVMPNPFQRSYIQGVDY